MQKDLCDQATAIEEIRLKIAASKGKVVDVYYQQGLGSRGNKLKNAVIGPAYDRFFEITVDVIYGTYKTTINYTDVYTHACTISVCES